MVLMALPYIIVQLLKLDLTYKDSDAVTNLGTNRWHKFRINLQDTFKLEKLMDIYVKVLLL